MTVVRPDPLDEGDRRELLRIVQVYAKEWLRSRRRPPGAPHRAALLAPSAAWLRMETCGRARDGLRLRADRPLWETLAAIAVELVAIHPSPALDQLAATRFEALVLGAPVPLPALKTALDVHPGLHLAVEHQGRAALVTACDAACVPWSLEAHLAACCRAAALDELAWQAPDARLYAFDAPLFTS